jgi:hypothetical protein
MPDQQLQQHDASMNSVDNACNAVRTFLCYIISPVLPRGSPVLPRGASTAVIIAKVIARLMVIHLGVMLVLASAMLSDMGTPEALMAAATCLAACLLFILSGVAGSIPIFFLALSSYVFGILGIDGFMTSLPMWIKKSYLHVVVPVALIWMLVHQFYYYHHLRPAGNTKSDIEGVNMESMLEEDAPNSDIQGVNKESVREDDVPVGGVWV